MTSSPRRVLMFLPDLDGGGAQRTFVNLAGALPEDRVLPTLVAARADGPAKTWLSAQVPLVDLGCSRVRHAILPLWRLIRDSRPDVVFATMADANVIAALATFPQAHRPKIILRETNSHRERGDISSLHRMLIGLTYRRADAIIALSEGVRRELVEDYRLEAARTVTIHNPVDIEGLAATVESYRHQPAPLEGEGRIILAMGRLHRQKGFDILIEAFAALSDPSMRLVILGEGEERAALEAQTKNLGVEARVHLPGFDARPERWLAYTDLFVLSSRWEGFGHVLAEAMAAGVPVIAARAPHGPEEIIEDGKTGLLVPVADPVALTQAMARLLDDRDWACRLAAQARITVERFALPVIADQYAEQIERVARLRDAAGGHQ